MRDTCQVVGVRADGTEHNLGEIRMPARMKARDMVREIFGDITDDNDAGMAFEICEQLIEYVEATPRIDPISELVAAHLCIKPACGAACSGCNLALTPQQQRDYAIRYALLRTRDLDTIERGGVFAGQTPRNVVLNGTDLDEAMDALHAGGTHA